MEVRAPSLPGAPALVSAPPGRLGRVRLPVSGMSCASCAASLESALLDQEGVREASVNFAFEEAVVAFDPQRTGRGNLVATIRRKGFSVPEPPSGASTAPGGAAAAGEGAGQRELSPETLKLIVCATLTAPLVAPMLLGPLGVQVHLAPEVQAALAAPVQLWGGARFYLGAWRALRAGRSNMDVLVALGTSAAFALSLASLYSGGPLYFEGAAAIVTFVRLGKWLEARARRSTTAAVRALMALRPDTARVRRGGQERRVPTGSITPGEQVVVRPGEYVPIDGIVVEGASEIDESLVTGESLPVAREPGSPVTQGSVNGSGLLVIESTHVAAESTLSRIARLVQDAQASKPPVQRLLDRVVAIFVPVIVVVAVATFGGWVLLGAGVEVALLNAVSVLVIACPCALGLATPATLAVGTGAAARAGILFKDIEALERADALDTVVFDKTGTLTEGHPEVREVIGPHPDRTLALASSAQYGSEHPLAEAVRTAATERGVPVPEASQFRSLPGRGVSAAVGGETVRVGSSAWMASLGIETAELEAQVAAHQAEGWTVSWVALGQRVLGALALGDRVRPSAAEAMGSLERAGLQTWMLTGDHRRAAQAVARSLGVRQVVAEVLPEDKAAQVARLRAQGRRVAVVGDGVNDAPALAAADLGVAMGTGSDVAMHSAGVTLMRPDLRLVVAMLSISRATRRKISQNLFWAFAYNTVGVPLAAFGFLSPVLAGLAMALSSVSVLANALLLKRWAPQP